MQQPQQQDNNLIKKTNCCDHSSHPSKDNDLKNIIVKDPVCGMDVDSTKAKYKTDYKKITYYFCNPKCEVKFNSNPDSYLLNKNIEKY